MDFELIEHRLEVVDSAGRRSTMALEPKSVARFYRELMDGLRSLDIEVRIWTDAVGGAADPDAAVREFFQSTYDSAADLGGWDRSALEPARSPERPPRGPWSVARDGS